MSDDAVTPIETYRRDDPGVDPPSVALGLDIERHVVEGDVVRFVDDEPDPVRVFKLHRAGGAFRVSHHGGPPLGAFASAQAAVRHGWRGVDFIASLPNAPGEHGGFR